MPQRYVQTKCRPLFSLVKVDVVVTHVIEIGHQLQKGGVLSGSEQVVDACVHAVWRMQRRIYDVIL